MKRTRGSAKLVLLLLIAALAGGAYYFFVYKPKLEAGAQPDRPPAAATAQPAADRPAGEPTLHDQIQTNYGKKLQGRMVDVPE